MSKTISTILNLKDNFSSTLKKTTGNTKEFRRKTKAAQIELGKLKKVAGTAFKTMGIAALAGVAAMGKVAQQSLDYADGVQKASDVTGMTVESVQKLTYVGENLGVSFDTIAGANSKLIKTMDAARKKTSPQAKAFKQLGINVVGSNGKLKDSKTIFQQAITKLHNMKNGTERNALAMKIFGKSAMQLNPLIKAGGKELSRLSEEAEKNGAVLSGDQVEALDNFGDTLGSLKLQFQGIGAQFAAELLPTVQGFSDKLKNMNFKQVIADVKEVAKNGFEALGKAIQFAKDNSQWLIPVLGGVVTAMAAFRIITVVTSIFKALTIVTIAQTIATKGFNVALKANPIGVVVTIIGLLITAGIALYQNWDLVKAKATAFWTALKEIFGNLKNSIVGKFTALRDKVMEIWNAIREFLLHPLKGTVDIVTNTIDAGKGSKQTEENRLAGRKALGTSYWKGGPTAVHERGGEIINLPNGTAVIPADKSKRMIENAGKGHTFVFNFSGNIGTEAFFNTAGEYITNKVLTALENV